MIRISDHNGQEHLISHAGILQVKEASVSSQWHGIRTYVRLFDGRTIEARETIDQIDKLIATAKAEERT